MNQTARPDSLPASHPERQEQGSSSLPDATSSRLLALLFDPSTHLFRCPECGTADFRPDGLWSPAQPVVCNASHRFQLCQEGGFLWVAIEK